MLDITYLFCVYSVLGWITEVLFFYVKTGRLHQRGILHGAYCPLYGFSLAVCTLLTRETRSFLLTVAVCALVCTVFELITAVFLDKVLQRKMWDYSGRRFNISGYICAGFTAIWGLSAAVCVKYLNPILLIGQSASFITFKTVICIALCALMIADMFSYVRIR